VGFIPVENILLGYEFRMITSKKFEFTEDSFESSAGLELNYRFYRNMVKLMLRTGYSFNFSRGFGLGNLNYGGGLEVDIGATAYRLDYTMKKSPHADVIGNLHYISVTLGESPSFFKWIVRKSIPEPKDMIFFNDYYVLKSGKEEKKEDEEEKKKKVYQISLKNLTTRDKMLTDSGLIDKFQAELINRIDAEELMDHIKDKGELVIKGNITRTGELLNFLVYIVDRESGKIIGKESFELAEEMFKYAMDYETVDILVRKDAQNVEIIPVEKGEESKEEEKVFRELADEVVGWLKNNITEFLSGEIKVICNFKDVDIYIDGFYYGKTSKKKRAEIDVFRGKHKLEFKLPKHPTEVREVVIEPRQKKTLNVTIKKGIVFNDYKITTMPSEMAVFLDGAKKGVTPLTLYKVDNTGHKLELEDDDGNRWQQHLQDDDEGIYNLFHFLKYSDSFSRKRTFWRQINRNPNIEVKIDGGLRIQGESKKEIYTENGIFTPYFIPGDIDISANIKMDIDDGFGMLGVMDIKGNGFAYANDGVYHQYLTWGASGGDNIVQAINIKKKSKENLIKINYKAGLFTAYVGEYELAEVEVELKKIVRVFILADGLEQGGAVDVECSRISIVNGK